MFGQNDLETSTYGAFSHFSFQSAVLHLSVDKYTKFEVSFLNLVCVKVDITENACLWPFLKKNASQKGVGNISSFANMFFF